VLPGLTIHSPVLLAVVISTVTMFVVAVGFLVAAARLRRSNNRKAALWARLEKSFGSTVDCIAYGTADAAELHSRIRPGERVVLLDYLYKTSMQETRPARLALYRELARPYLPELERRARQGDVWQRARAIRTLAELAGADARGVIIDALDAPEPHVAMTAARAYAQLRLGGVEPLLARIERYLNWDRRLLRSVLVSFGAGAAPALHERLADRSAAPAVRAVCADALAALDFRDAGDTAAVALLEERDIDLIASTLRLLRAPATPAQRAIVRQLCVAEDDVIRGQAVGCLARIGDEADLAFVDSARADASPWVVRSAVQGLAGRTAVRPVPIEALDVLGDGVPAGAIAGDATGAAADGAADRADAE
jgi:HEAT repeat protein